MKKIIACITTLSLLLTGCTDNSRRREIDQRWEALREKQRTELERAEKTLQRSDSLLQIAEKEVAELQQQVDADKEALKATPEELTRLTKMRLYRDSLKTDAEVQGAKIRYIRVKMKEVKGAKDE